MGAAWSRDRGEGGTASVELALILVPLLLVLFGVIEWGKVLSQVEVYNGMAREGARCAAVQAAQASTGLPVCDIYDSITGAGTGLGWYQPPAVADVEVAVDGGIVGPYACSGNIGDEVTVGWDQPLAVDIVFFGEVTLTHRIQATFRCE